MKPGIKRQIWIFASLIWLASPFILDWVRSPHVIDMSPYQKGCGVSLLKVDSHGYSFERMIPEGSVTLLRTYEEGMDDFHVEKTLQFNIGAFGPGIHNVEYFEALMEVPGVRDGCVTDMTYLIWVPIMDLPDVSFDKVFDALKWHDR